MFNKYSPTIDVIRSCLNFCVVVKSMYLPDMEKINATQKEIDEILKIDPFLELDELLKTLNEKQAELNELKKVSELAKDMCADVLAQYESQMQPEPKPKSRRKKGGNKQ